MDQEESEHNEVDEMKKEADSTGEVMYTIVLSWSWSINSIV